MIRKTILSTALLLALVFGALSANADAQGQCRDYNDRIVGCTSIAGAFAPQPTPVAAATTTAATTTDSGEATVLAFTGAESNVLGYVGAGMIGVGAVALGIRRKL